MRKLLADIHESNFLARRLRTEDGMTLRFSIGWRYSVREAQVDLTGPFGQIGLQWTWH